MPLGNGDIGLNVWVEDGGDLLFYLSKTDAWDENARLISSAEFVFLSGRIRSYYTPRSGRNWTSQRDRSASVQAALMGCCASDLG